MEKRRNTRGIDVCFEDNVENHHNPPLFSCTAKTQKKQHTDDEDKDFQKSTKKSKFASIRKTLFFNKICNHTINTRNSSSHIASKKVTIDNKYSFANLKEDAIQGQFRRPSSPFTNTKSHSTRIHLNGSICNSIFQPDNFRRTLDLIDYDPDWIMEARDEKFEIGPLSSRFENLDTKIGTFTFYKDYFAFKEHYNYLAVDKLNGLVSMSVAVSDDHKDLRAVIRSKERQMFLTLPINKNSHFPLKVDSKDIFKKILPLGWKLKGITQVRDEKHVVELSKFEDLESSSKFKWGVLYCIVGQRDENEIFANENPSADFEEFLECLGEKIELRGWKKYNGGLDTAHNTTGTHSYYREFGNLEIMYHVSTILPCDKSCEQKLERKRHLGNDIVTIVFLDGPKSGEFECFVPFGPKTIKTHFQHILAVVKKDPTSTGEKVLYQVNISRKKDVPSFGPLFDRSRLYSKEEIGNLFLEKLVQAERAAMKTPTFQNMLSRSRYELIKSYHDHYASPSSNITIK